MSAITWLHISDLHFQESQNYNSNIVISSLLDHIRERIKDNSLTPDFIIISGDIANRGLPEEYSMASRFLKDLLEITSTPKERLFLVPGNHDVDRTVNPIILKGLRTQLIDRNSVDEFLSNEECEAVVRRFYNYYAFLETNEVKNNYISANGLCYTKIINVNGFNLAILGLNSAWISIEQEEKGKLLLGERQIREALETIKGADIKLVLFHHPFEWLRDFDSAKIDSLLSEYCDFILQGHLHRPRLSLNITPDSEVITISAGACYESRDYPNSYNFVKIDLDKGKFTLFLYIYSDNSTGFWTKDVTTYRNAPDGVCIFDLPKNFFRSGLSSKGNISSNGHEKLPTRKEASTAIKQPIDDYDSTELTASISNLSKYITVDSIQSTKLPDDENDPIKPIKAIIIRSLKEYDEGTVRYGLNTIGSSIGVLFDLDGLSDIQIKKIAEISFFHLSLIGTFAVDLKDIYATTEVISAL